MKTLRGLLQIFGDSLLNFPNVKNYLFESASYGLMFYKQDKNKQLSDVRPIREEAQDVLGDDL